MSRSTVTEEFVRQLAIHHNSLLAFITALVGDVEHANDVLQETHVQLWKMADEFEPGSNFFAWACSVARYKVLELRAQRSRDKLIFSDELLDKLSKEAEQHESALEDGRSALQDCLDQLPARQRDLVQRRYAPGGTVKRLAAELKRTPQSVAVTLFRIRQRLMDCVQRKTSGGIA